MNPPLPSITKTWHNDTYPAISPDRSELSATGKTVVITGSGGTIGTAVALSFAAAQAKHIVLLGRDKSALRKTQQKLPNSCTSEIHVFDVTNEEHTKQVAHQIGNWDVLVGCAGYIPDAAPIEKSNSLDWWKGFETNVKGTYNTIKAFIPTANPSQASIVAMTSGPLIMPTSAVVGLSSYLCSKLAQTKLLEFVSAENPHISTFSLHPGMVESAIFRKSGGDPTKLPMDTAQLPGDFTVWLASPEGRFLSGRMVWANWDVEELVAQKDQLGQSLRLTVGDLDFPYPHVAKQ